MSTHNNRPSGRAGEDLGRDLQQGLYRSDDLAYLFEDNLQYETQYDGVGVSNPPYMNPNPQYPTFGFEQLPNWRQPIQGLPMGSSTTAQFFHPTPVTNLIPMNGSLPPEPSANRYACPWIGCGKTYRQEKSLWRHVDLEHLSNGQKNFSCQCGKPDGRKDNHRRHVKTCDKKMICRYLCKCTDACGDRTEHLEHLKRCGKSNRRREDWEEMGNQRLPKLDSRGRFFR